MTATKTKKAAKQWPTFNAKPYFENDHVRLYHGDSLHLLREAEGGGVNAIVTDPPYCTGAATTNGKAASTESKYRHSTSGKRFDSFDGDTRDARSYAFWVAMWLSMAARLCVRDQSYVLTFIDWRMLGTMTDAIQAAGLTFRGITVWNKGRGSRTPHKGYFRHQCEYIPWASIGKTPKLEDRGPFDGCFSFPVKVNDKHHQTGKPTPLMRELVQVAPIGGLVLDPFAGSGTTGVAAMLEGRRAILIESNEAIAETAAERLRKGQ